MEEQRKDMMGEVSRQAPQGMDGGAKGVWATATSYELERGFHGSGVGAAQSVR